MSNNKLEEQEKLCKRLHQSLTSESLPSKQAKELYKMLDDPGNGYGGMSPAYALLTRYNFDSEKCLDSYELFFENIKKTSFLIDGNDDEKEPWIFPASSGVSIDINELLLEKIKHEDVSVFYKDVLGLSNSDVSIDLLKKAIGERFDGLNYDYVITSLLDSIEDDYPIISLIDRLIGDDAKSDIDFLIQNGFDIKELHNCHGTGKGDDVYDALSDINGHENIVCNDARMTMHSQAVLAGNRELINVLMQRPEYSEDVAGFLGSRNVNTTQLFEIFSKIHHMSEVTENFKTGLAIYSAKKNHNLAKDIINELKPRNTPAI